MDLNTTINRYLTPPGMGGESLVLELETTLPFLPVAGMLMSGMLKGNDFVSEWEGRVVEVDYFVDCQMLWVDIEPEDWSDKTPEEFETYVRLCNEHGWDGGTVPISTLQQTVLRSIT